MSKINVICFTLYSIVFEAIVWGGWFWIVFVLDKSAWWTLLAIVIGGAQLKGSSFGIGALRSEAAVATPPQDTVTVSREEWDTKCAELASAIRMLWMVQDRFSSASYSEYRQIQGKVERWLESHDPEQIHFATLRASAQAPAQRGEG